MVTVFSKYSRHFYLPIGLWLLWAIPLTAQEADPFAADSLLFGEEFDLGDDFDLGGETLEDTSTGLEGLGGELDDWLNTTDTDSLNQDTIAVDTAADEWGFLEPGGDVDSILEGEVTEEEIPEHPLDLGRWVDGTFLEDTGFTLSLTSPHVVASQLDTWYSYIDFSLSMNLPWHFQSAPADISFSVDVSSFDFQNTFPAGGRFHGVSIMPLVQAEAFGFEGELGMGMFSSTFGLVSGLGYNLTFHSLFISTGYRWNWAYTIKPIGSAWWLEPRFTLGIRFW